MRSLTQRSRPKTSPTFIVCAKHCIGLDVSGTTSPSAGSASPPRPTIPIAADGPNTPPGPRYERAFSPRALREAASPEQSLELVRAARYTGYRRLLDRIAVGLATTLEQMDTDPGAAVVAYGQYLHRRAGRIKHRQNKRVAAWRRKETEARRQGFPPPLMPDLQRGLGARVDTPMRAEKRMSLLDMALGVFTSAGVVHLRVQRVRETSSRAGVGQRSVRHRLTESR